MSRAKPRLRMFAGPNGSGKSTIKALVEAEIGPELLGVPHADLMPDWFKTALWDKFALEEEPL